MAAGLILFLPNAQAQTQLFFEDFTSPNAEWMFEASGDSAAWMPKTGGGVGNSRSLRCSRVTNAAGSQADKYFAVFPGLALTNGHHYTIRFQSKIAQANARRMKLAWNASPSRNGATLIQDFDTLVASETFQTYSTAFTATSTQTHYFILYGENLLAHADPVPWYVDDVEVFRDNQLPEIAITIPANMAQMPEGPTTLTATASDPDGSIARVVFYVDEDSVGQDITSPYSLTNYLHPKEEEGQKTYLHARAYDNAGAYAQANINVDVLANTCDLELPETSRQIICSYDSVAFKAIANNGGKKCQWQHWQVNQWQENTGDTLAHCYKKPGIYRARITYPNGAICYTREDTVVGDGIKVNVTNFLPNQIGFYHQYFATAKIQSGIKPYSLNWTNLQECLTENCDSILILSPFDFTILSITDSLGCSHSDTATGGLFGRRFVIPNTPLAFCDGPNLICNPGFEESVNLNLAGGGSGNGKIANAKHWDSIDGVNVDYYRTNGVSGYDISSTMIYEEGNQGMQWPNLHQGITNNGFVGIDPVFGVFGQLLGTPIRPGHRYIFKHFWGASGKGQYIPKISPFGISVLGSGDELIGTYNMSFPTTYNDPPLNVWSQYFPGTANVIQFPSVEGAKYVIHNTSLPFPPFGPLEPNWLIGNFGGMMLGLRYAYLDEIYLAPFPTLSCSELFVPPSSGVQIQFEEDDTWLGQFTADNNFIYSWSPTTALNNPTIARPTATPSTKTTYTCSITLGIGGPSYTVGSVTVYPSNIIDLGTNPPRGCCPIAYTTNAACTQDFDNTVTGPDLTFDVVVQKVGSNPFKELYITTYGEDFGTDINVKFLSPQSLDFEDINEEATIFSNGAFLTLTSSQVNGYSQSNYATFRIRIDATESNPTGNFEYQIYTLDPGSPGPDCCRRITKSGLGFNPAFAPYFPILQERNEVLDWKVFPNPAKREITLETQWENSIYSITNALGKVVQTGLIGQSSQKIQVNNLPEGYYQISVIHEGIRSVKSLLIQK